MMRFFCLLILACFSLASGLEAAPLSPSLQAVLQTSREPVAVIVRMTTTDVRSRVKGLTRKAARRTLIASLKQETQQGQGALIDYLHQQGVKKTTSLWLINGLAFSASPQLIAQLQSWPGVELISVNQTVPRPVVLPAATAAVEWNIDMIGAPQLWAQGFDGTGVVVASLDTGVDVTHPDLSGNWRGGTNSWFDPYSSSSLPYDPVTGDPLSEGHGTAVMGVMVGGRNGGSAIGVAPGAQWIAAKIFPDTGAADSAKIIQALGWALDPDNNPATDDGADIVNNSWGYESVLNQCLSASGLGLNDMQIALNNLIAADVAVIFSAGNTGPFASTSIPPGNMSGVLSVGAININKEVAFFSARGPSPCDAPGEVFPNLVAPGMSVRSAGLFSGYVSVDGTSFSAPQVAGALALLRQAFPGPSTSMTSLETAVEQLASDLGTPGADDVYGHGLLNVAAAYNQLQGINPLLVMIDPTPPSSDKIIDFASVAPLNSRSLSLLLKNGGGGSLVISGIDASLLDPAFSVVKDLCSGRSLSGGASCSVELGFAPQALGSYTSSLTVFSSDPAGSQTLTLKGLGNNAPPAATLLLPVDGAVGIARPVNFSWHRDMDLDGDQVTDFLLISAHGDFSDSTPITAALPQGLLLLAGGGIFWGLWGARRLKGWLWLVLILGLAFCLVSCGGSNASPASVLPNPSGGYQSTSLLPNTTYYWKVRSVDSRGGVSESVVRSFTTGI
ncbi:S8 family serine peptidase [Geopsychrobacter electrodiphilus]|uniref:S8 family serine peptidase n=1 Tax=Geopsychrobacter electrodiphilus TaxID=225196 RepID=UPI00037D529F|nr:S8 family serine peptidase [Geopsychrobacter electrodiphilus]